VAVTCEPDDREFLFRIARAWGSRPFALEDAVRTRYHAAAVFASNYLVTAAWVAEQVMRSAGLGDPRPLLAPLMEATIRNVVGQGPERALTGPVVRGDADVVRRHVQELRCLGAAERPVADAYGAMARLTAHLAGVDPRAFEEATA
jgi:predicted short-subunit dehydrogenase-like oxidoreductase (DUF2520 family)